MAQKKAQSIESKARSEERFPGFDIFISKRNRWGRQRVAGANRSQEALRNELGPTELSISHLRDWLEQPHPFVQMRRLKCYRDMPSALRV